MDKEEELLNIEDFKNYPLFRAVIELNDKMKEMDLEKIELNVVGGFALMIKGYRDANGVTDVDYVGPELSRKVKEVADEVGYKNHIGSDWINNDCLMSGTTLEDLEYSTGKLHFEEVFDLDKIKVNVLDAEDLLRLKLIAIDTQLCAVDSVSLSEFTRYKDFKDVKTLLEKQEVSIEYIRQNADKYGLVDKNTPRVIQAYMTRGIKGAKIEMRKCYEEERSTEPCSFSNDYVASPVINNMLSQAMKRAREEDYR